MEDNDIKDKRERLVACVLSGNSKMYLGKEHTEQQINEMDCDSVNALLNRYESVLSAQMTKSLGKSIINLYSNVACSLLGIGNQQELSTDLESDPFLKGGFPVMAETTRNHIFSKEISQVIIAAMVLAPNFY